VPLAALGADQIRFSKARICFRLHSTNFDAAEAANELGSCGHHEAAAAEPDFTRAQTSLCSQRFDASTLLNLITKIENLVVDYKIDDFYDQNSLPVLRSLLRCRRG
jgi:hypothetical protein